VIPNSLTTSRIFQKITVANKSDGLPPGVQPMDIKIMTATLRTLGIVTKTGEVWMIGGSIFMYGDGSSFTNSHWHQVQSATVPYLPLTKISQFRISTSMAFAVDSNNIMYTW